jgi:hypothetical protein
MLSFRALTLYAAIGFLGLVLSGCQSDGAWKRSMSQGSTSTNSTAEDDKPCRFG